MNLNLDDASPVGGGRVRPVAASRKVAMGWLQAGFILFAFAAPSAVMAVPYAIGMAGMVGGILICIVITTASVAGAMMLLEAKLAYPACHTFGDLGLQVMGRPGEIWGNLIQLGNFCLFMPCALQFCALALEGIGNIPGFNGCSDYYVFTIAAVCLLTTQVRTFSNTKILSIVSIICVFAMMASMIVAAYKYENPEKVDAQLFGNPHEGTTGMIMFAGGFTINAWAFVPGFLTVELSTCMESPKDFRKSLVFSGILNIFVFVVLGLFVVSQWGYILGEVITIPVNAGALAAYASGNGLNTAFNIFQLTGNFVSYMLDSVPLGRYCQKIWNPEFKDTWSAPDCLRYLGYTLPTFLFAFFLAIAVPSVNTLLDFTTALTTPWVTQIYPAVLYWKLRRKGARSLLNDQTCTESPSDGKLSTFETFVIGSVFLVGCISFIICSTKAFGYIIIKELRPPLQIGCPGWEIWKSA